MLTPEMIDNFMSVNMNIVDVQKLADVRWSLITPSKVHENGNINVKLKFSNEYRRVAEYIQLNTHSNAV